MTIRCSSLDAAFDCPASVLADAPVRVNPANKAADVGSAVHEMLCSFIEKGSYQLSPIAFHHGLAEADEAEAAELASYGEQAWQELEKYFPAPRVEVAVKAKVSGTEHEVTGTVDCLSPVGLTNAIFLDWKTGFIDDGYRQQMNGYAFCLWDALGRPDNVVISGVVVFLRHRYYRVVKWDAARLKTWEYDLSRNILSKPNEYKPGAACKHCDLYSSCAARRQMVEATLDAMLFNGAGGPGSQYAAWLAQAKGLLATLDDTNKNDPVVAEALTKMLTRVKMAEDAAKETRELIRSTVDRVGPIRLSETTAMVLRDVERKTVNPPMALPVLRTRLSDAQICECMTLSLPKLADRYAAGKPSGQRGKFKGLLEHELANANALTISVQRRLEEVDITTVEEFQDERSDQDSPDKPKAKRARAGAGAGGGGGEAG